MNHVRGSEVSSFLRCRKQWKYAWIDNLEPKRQDNKLFFGNLAHKFLEVYYSNFGQDHIPPAEMGMIAMKELFRKTDTSGMPQTEIDELWDLASGVMENYVKQWQEADEGITVLATELRFAIPLDDETVYEGTIDMVYLDRDKRLFFKDYKNVASIERYVDMAEMDRQISRYWWALEQLSRGNGYLWDQNLNEWFNTADAEKWWGLKLIEPSGFVYDLILKDVPNVPEILKKGGLSKAKAQKTTLQVYMQALHDNGLAIPSVHDSVEFPSEYAEILEHLHAQETEFGNRFFRRIPVVRNERETQAAMQEFMTVVYDMQNIKNDFECHPEGLKADFVLDRTYRNINADCSWCNYKALCVAEMDGSNAEMTKNLAYRQKEIKQNGSIIRFSNN